ncbi:hypothetical protein PBY51_023461 [Eleginops maclovinus]|uniref:Uncharacterized protein n=1 Tax=Eleginops maclovinus TaxID=56733 RepID=A0AAN7X0Y7_ELEMC|nr:hypothetical protein PBY51_023461 [Eleginops maclovinus]
MRNRWPPQTPQPTSNPSLTKSSLPAHLSQENIANPSLLEGGAGDGDLKGAEDAVRTVCLQLSKLEDPKTQLRSQSRLRQPSAGYT